ncbi:MAG: two-component sensor histidine kinase, partial [Proteobacteria bacterium]|nr:two-component sensor histidine kinase [Pseudomonadota bacterium]
IFIYQFHRSYEEKVHAHLKELVLKHQHEIETYLNQHLSLIRFLANTFSEEQLAQDQFLAELLAELHSGYGHEFADLGFVDAQGKQVAYAGPFRLERALYAGAEWFEQSRGRETFISDVFLGLRGLPHFIVTVRKSSPSGDFILRATVDFNAFSRLVENIRVGETGFAYILNSKGEFQTQYMPGSDDRTVFMPKHHMEISHDSVVVRTEEDDEGREHITVSVPLKDGEWRLVYQQNSADAYQMLRRTRVLTVSILVIGGILIVTTVLFLSRRMAARVARADHEKEEVDRQMVEAGRLATIGELAAGIAHEINNPVAIMVEEAGWIEDLLDDGEMEHEAQVQNVSEFRRALEQIRIQGQRCKEITHKLLHFARRTDSTAQGIEIDKLMGQILSLVEQRAKYSKVNIVAQLHGQLPLVLGSPSELQQVVLNLVNNAIDAMGRDGGLIVASTGLRENENENKVFMQVSDNGQGIPEANLPHIFDPFFTTKPVGKGTGLGLSICYGIVTRMGGEIEVQSRVGEGTVFTVLLPVSEEARMIEAGQQYAEQHYGEGV